jgi:hypothetical protein
MNRADRVRGVSLASFILCCTGMVSSAWSTGSAGSIGVTIFHRDDSPMADALVTLYRGRDRPVIRQARTCDDGLVLFEDLEPATYEVRAAKPEYATIVVFDIVVLAGRRVSCPIALRRADSPQPCDPLAGQTP